jgi:hypothetical protein
MKLRELGRQLLTSKYSRALEADVLRLRLENRALLNSILGIAGVPPIVVAPEDLTAIPGTVNVSTAKLGTSKPVASAQVEMNINASGSEPGTGRSAVKNLANVTAPTRRRSWHQIYRMLEIDSARKKESI